MKQPYLIRPLLAEEQGQLRLFLLNAVYQKPGSPPLDPSLAELPMLSQYWKDFSRPGDHCLVAERDGRLVGAVWTRLLPQGYGHVADDTPELSISVLDGYRGQGLGTLLIRAMLQTLSGFGYRNVSLSVQKENPACALYTRLGFALVREDGEDLIMMQAL